jgi:hypothetical protein
MTDAREDRASLARAQASERDFYTVREANEIIEGSTAARLPFRRLSNYLSCLPALKAGRRWAMAMARTKEPKGRRYAESMRLWYQLHPQFQVIATHDREALLKLADPAVRAALDDILATLSWEKRQRIRTPASAYKRVKAELDRRRAQEGR